ncbi:MAG: carboxypeptidase-like regulatory domain-containing protein [Bryobacteraceae bacterium]
MNIRQCGIMILALCSMASLFGQVNKSSLTGIVRDSSGAPVAGVTLKCVHTGSGAVRQQTSDYTGLYRFTLLDFGLYRLDVEHAGFKKFVRTGIQLETGQTTTVDVTLEIGEMAESVTVTAESPLLRTETGALGTTANMQTINEVPLIGRNPYVFLELSPGIQYTGVPSAITPMDNAGPSDFAASGSRSRSEFLLDGIPNMRPDQDLVSFSPSPDAVEEMRLQTNSYDAEYGHSGAAFVNVSLKSGTNTLHGGVYWYLRNYDLNANNFFNNRSGQPRNKNKQNTYGFTLGGPVTIPKFYSGRDRTHFFSDFEGLQSRGESLVQSVVPTVLERAGDFSRTVDRSGRAFMIYDPQTTRPAGGGFVRDPFPNNMIPLSRQDPVARNAIQFYPIPTRDKTPDVQQNFVNPRSTSTRWGSTINRVDHQLSANHHLFFRFGWNHRTGKAGPFFGECCRVAGDPTSGEDAFYRGNITGAASYTWIRSNRTVVDFRMGYTRYFEINAMYGEGFDLSKLGFPPSFTRAVLAPTFPRFENSGDVETLGAQRMNWRIFTNAYNPAVNVHTTLGRHALKYGFRYQVEQSNEIRPLRSGGSFTFNRLLTQGPDPTKTATNSGHDVASLLLGTASAGFVDLGANKSLENTYSAFYLQDDWKATDRLSLNLGLRFEHEWPITERYNRGNAGFDFGVANPIASQAQANYLRNPIPELSQISVKGGLRFLNSEGAPRGNLEMPALLYGPRFGYAYRLNNWIVWRGGYGLFYIPNSLGYNGSSFSQTGFSMSTNMVTSLDNNLTPFNRLSDPFPNGLVQPLGSAGGLLTALGQTLTGASTTAGKVPKYLQGMSEQFSMGFQFILPGQISVEPTYAGNVSQRLSMSRNVDQYPNDFLALTTRLNAKVSNPFYGVITDITSSLSQPTTTVSQLLRPYPEFLGMTQLALPYGRSHEDSMQLLITKRMAHGLYFGAAYTISKFMEGTSYLNANDPKPERVISGSDRPQRLVLHGIYALPFGAGKRFFSSTPVVRNLVGGWQFNWVVTFQSMEALAFTGAQRVLRSDKNPHSLDQWFDVTQFVPQPPFTLTTLSSRLADLRGPGIKKWDLTAMKHIRITERVEMRLLGEFYNAWNTTLFNSPNTTVTSASFGRITSTRLGPREIQLSSRIAW